jgi:hypothetical protein
MSQSFASLGVSAEVEHALTARGIVEPFRIQTLVVPDALAGRDILGQAPTGCRSSSGSRRASVLRRRSCSSQPASWHCR